MKSLLNKVKDLMLDNIKCCKCGQVKLRKTVGQSPNGKRKYRQDENGKPWNGNVCPSCYMASHKKYMRVWRGAKEPKQTWYEYMEKAKSSDVDDLKDLVRQLEKELLS